MGTTCYSSSTTHLEKEEKINKREYKTTEIIQSEKQERKTGKRKKKQLKSFKDI